MKKSFNRNDLIVEKKLCHLCKAVLIKNCCPDKDCNGRLLKKAEAVKKSIKVVTANVHVQLSTILSNHYSTMIKYKRISSLTL